MCPELHLSLFYCCTQERTCVQVTEQSSNLSFLSFMLLGICFCNCTELLDMRALDYDSFFRYLVILEQEQVILRQERAISSSDEICVSRKKTTEWGKPEGW